MLNKSDHSTDTVQEASYFPPPGDDWARLEPEATGMKAAPLAGLKEFAAAHESTTWPRSIVNEQGIFNNASITDKPEWNELIGPVKPRGGPNGVILRRWVRSAGRNAAIAFQFRCKICRMGAIRAKGGGIN